MTISHREYHPSSCQCYYHWIDTSAGGLLVTESISSQSIRPVSVTITGSTPLLVDYQSQRVSSVQLSVLLSLDRHLCWWTISHREYHPSSCQCYYHWIDTSAGGLLVTESIIRPVVSVTITGSTPLLVDYQSQRVSSVQLSVLLSLDRHLCWWTISHREYHPSSCQCYYHWIDTSAGGLLVTESIIRLVVSVTIHWIDTSAVGLLVTESIIRPVVSVTITGSTPLLVDYQSQRVSSVQLSVLLPLDRHLCWWTISHREYHPSSCQCYYPLDRHLCWWTISHREYHPSSSQCFYHQIDTSAGGLLVTESIIRPVVSVTTTGSTPLLVDYQSQRVSSVQQSVFLSLDRHLCWWTISHREYHSSSCQCFYHWIDTSAGGLLVTESIIRPVVSVTTTGSTPLLVDYQSQRVSSVQLSVLLPLDRHLCSGGSTPISHREYHPSSSQCFYHWIDTSAGGLLVTESIIRLVVSVTTTGSTPLLVDCQSQRVSSVQLSVLLPLDRHLCCWTISHREYHPSSSQCFYHWIDTSAGGLLVTESIIRPVVSVTITGSTPLLLDYQSQRVSSIQLSVLLSLDRHLCWWTISHREYHPSESVIRLVVSVTISHWSRHLCWWTVSHREYHPSSCQCYYHWIDTSAGELLVTESIIRPVVSVTITGSTPLDRLLLVTESIIRPVVTCCTITGSTPLLVDYQSQRVSSVQLSVLLPLDRHLCCWTISHREYHPSSSQCFYHWIDTSAGGLLVTESIILSSCQCLLPLDRHLCWWTISHREYHPSSCQCYYHWIDTSAGGLLVTESIIRPVVSVTTTGSTPLLVDYQSQRVSSVQLSVLLPLDRHLCWWTISHREYHPSSCQCYYHWIDTSAGGLLVTESIIRPVVSVTTTGSTPLLLDYQSQRVSSVQQSVFLSLDRHLCWWTISHREYHPSSCQCYYHWIDTSAGGLLVTESIIRPVVSVTTTGSTPLLLDYQSQRVSSVQLSVFLSLDRHLCWWTISHREYHPSSCQCYYHWIDTSAGGLLVTESIIRPVVSVTITGSTPLLVDYQSQRVSSVQLSVLLPLDRHLSCWTISHPECHPSSCQCYYHWIDTSAGGLLVTESIIPSSCQCYYHWIDTSAVGLLVTESVIHPVLLSVLLPLDRHLCWWTISHREYHPSSSQCFYHWIDTSAGGLLVTESIIRPVVSFTTTGSTPLRWTVSHRECHPSSCHYHWIDTSAGGLLVTESIIRPVVSVSITGSTPLLVDYQSQRVASLQLSVLLPLDRHLCWWTVSHREYHSSNCQCYYHWIDTSAVGLLVTESVIHPVVSVTTTGSTPLLLDYQSQKVSFFQQSVFLSLDRHLCWWTISHREYHPSSCQCYYHWIDTSAGELLVTESIIRPVVSGSITGSTPLLLNYQSQRVSFVQQSVLLSLDRSSAGGLLVTESIIRLLSVLLPLDRHLCW